MSVSSSAAIFRGLTHLVGEWAPSASAPHSRVLGVAAIARVRGDDGVGVAPTRCAFPEIDGETLDFDAGGATLYTDPVDLDGTPSSFGSTERGAIAAIWDRVAEDSAVFDIDVTADVGDDAARCGARFTSGGSARLGIRTANALSQRRLTHRQAFGALKQSSNSCVAGVSQPFRIVDRPSL